MKRIKNVGKLLGDWVELEVLLDVDGYQQVGKVLRSGHASSVIKAGAIVIFATPPHGGGAEIRPTFLTTNLYIRDDHIIAELELEDVAESRRHGEARVAWKDELASEVEKILASPGPDPEPAQGEIWKDLTPPPEEGDRHGEE